MVSDIENALFPPIIFALSNISPIMVMMMLYLLWSAHEVFMNTYAVVIAVTDTQTYYSYTLQHLHFLKGDCT